MRSPAGLSSAARRGPKHAAATAVEAIAGALPGAGSAEQLVQASGDCRCPAAAFVAAAVRMGAHLGPSYQSGAEAPALRDECREAAVPAGAWVPGRRATKFAAPLGRETDPTRAPSALTASDRAKVCCWLFSPMGGERATTRRAAGPSSPATQDRAHPREAIEHHREERPVAEAGQRSRVDVLEELPRLGGGQEPASLPW